MLYIRIINPNINSPLVRYTGKAHSQRIPLYWAPLPVYRTDCGQPERDVERMVVMGARIEEHPILGKQEKGRLVTFYFDGKELTGYEGEPIAAALKAQGVMIHRYTKKEHKPRGIFCAIGRCTDCVMVVNGKPNIRTCVTPLEEGMKVQTQYGVSDKPFEEQ